MVMALSVLSCGPSKHAVHVEMRHPSKAGVDLAGKSLSVVYLEDGNKEKAAFGEAMADGFAYALEQDYATGEGSVGVYHMTRVPGGDYSSKDTLVSLLMDTGADFVFLLDTVTFGQMAIGGPSHVALPASADSSYVSTASLPYTIRMYGFDAMNKDENVYAFGGSSSLQPAVYSDGNQPREIMLEKAWKAMPADAWEAGRMVAASFESQWKHEQYSITYFDGDAWYKALDRAESYDWKGAMDIWFKLLETNDLLRRSCAEYNIAVSCYMLGDYGLALSWLDRSDTDSKLPISDALRKRIEERNRR